MIQLSLNVLLVMDCVTARCGRQVQPTKMTLARQRVLRLASDLEHTEGHGFEFHLGLRFFLCPLLVDSYDLPYFLYNINISGIG